MIKLFRTIRQQSLSENKFSKYLIYAIGEIVLVVIGILIALSINNWNETEKQSIKTEKLIVRLNKQIELNIENSQQRIDLTKKVIKNQIKLMLIVGKPVERDDETMIDSLFTYSIYDHSLNLDLNALTEAQDNGEISSIKNDSLRGALYKLSNLTRLNEQREITSNADNLNFMVPYFYKNGNWRNISSTTIDKYRKEIGYSRLEESNYTKILTDREFENLLDSRIFYAEETLFRLKYLKQHLEYINKLLDQEEE